MLKIMEKYKFGGQTYLKAIDNLNWWYFHIHPWRGHSLGQLKLKISLELLCKTSMGKCQNCFYTTIFKVLIYLGFKK